MDKNEILLGALRLRGARRNDPASPLKVDEVRAVGAALGFGDKQLIDAVEALARDGRAEALWGGSVRLLTSPPHTANGPQGSPVFNLTGTFNGPLGIATGSGTQFDMRGSGDKARYTESAAPVPKLEETVAALAVAVAELRALATALPEVEAAQVSALADEAETITQEAQEEPDRPDFGDRLKKLADGVEQASRVQEGATKLAPTWTLLKTGVAALMAWLNGS